MIRSQKHLKYIRQLPCAVCGSGPPYVAAAHVRFGGRIGKGGISLKPSDDRTVPLCYQCHAEQHQIGEPSFWKAAGLDPLELASILYDISGDEEQGKEILRGAKWL